MHAREQPGLAARIGWIGVGKMGNPLVRLLLHAGLVVTLLEPVLENRASAVAAGGQVAGSVGDVTRASELIFCTLNDDDAVEDLLFGSDALAEHLRPDQVLVEMSTISPRLSARIGLVLASRGVAYLRAPMSGSTGSAGASTLTIMASGPDFAWRRAEPILSILAARSFWIGTGEEARYAKLAVDVLLGSTAALMADALAIGRAGGVDPEALIDILCESAVGSPLLRTKHDALLARDFDPAFSVAQMIQDLDLIAEVAAEAGHPLKLLSEVRRRFDSAARAGLADQDFFVLVRDQLESNQSARHADRPTIRSISS